MKKYFIRKSRNGTFWIYRQVNFEAMKYLYVDSFATKIEAENELNRILENEINN